MSIIDQALDQVESMQHSDGAWKSIYTYEATKILKELARDYELEISKQKARADAYEVIIKNIQINITGGSKD